MVERAFPARSAQDAFLCGLFSLLDVMLDMPLEEIVQQIALSSSVRNALVAKKGTLHEILCLAQYYEQREWDNVQVQARKLKLPEWAAIDAMSVATAWADATVA